MGVTLRTKHHKTYDMGYGTFNRLRDGISSYASETPQTGTVQFLSLPDCDGKLSPKECRHLLNDIQDMEDNGTLYGYLAFGKDGCMTLTDFKDMLRTAHRTRCCLFWN